MAVHLFNPNEFVALNGNLKKVVKRAICVRYFEDH